MFFRNLLFVLFLFFVGPIFGQVKNVWGVNELIREGKHTSARKAIDSILKTQNIETGHRGNLFLSRAKINRIENYNEAYKKDLQAVFNIAKQTKDQLLEANALSDQLKYVSANSADFSKTVAKYTIIANETQEDYHLYNSNFQLCYIALKANKPDIAFNYYEKSAFYFKRWEKTDELSLKLKITKANIYKRAEKYSNAIDVLKSILEKENMNKIPSSKTQVLSLLGVNALNNKEYKNSFQWSIQSNALANQYNISLFKETTFANITSLFSEIISVDNRELLMNILKFYNVKTINDALIIIEKKLNEITRVGQKEKIFLALSQLFKHQKNTDKAFYYNEKWSDIKIKRIESSQLNLNNFYELELSIANLNSKNEKLAIENETFSKQQIILVLSVIIVIIIGILIWFYQQLKIKNQNVKQLILEKDLLSSFREKARLKKDLDHKEAELKTSINQMIFKNNQIKILEEKLKTSTKKKEEGLKDELKTEKNLISENWVSFSLKFKQLYPRFRNVLENELTGLSYSEKKLAMLIFLNLSSKEIANLLGISFTSVNQAKYRLKKKIRLEKNISLSEYFQKISSY